MSSTFTPSDTIDMSKERDWPANLGMLDWDNTSIVFTKRTLIEFLKYTGTTVDTNFNNISKLPRYAKFGKMTESASGPAEVATSGDNAASSRTSVDEFRPSRRVREAPGGPQTDIFSHEVDDDALAMAPPREGGAQPIVERTPSAPSEKEEEPQGLDFGSNFRPSRRVREAPGGKDNLSNFWDAEEGTPAFKPTRRVREIPGGHDSVGDLF